MADLEVIREPQEMQARSERFRARGKRIVFVPTMGFLHHGHVALLREGRRRGDSLVLSIFVNPIQFGVGEDLNRYPRDLPGDLAKAREAGVDLAFVPDVVAMYPPGSQTRVEVRDLSRGLCGDLRPGHFAGVATVVLKLVNIVKPHVMILGEKDYQQLLVVRRMAMDLSLDVEVVGHPIVREPDGLAMSSRNSYLSTEERSQATVLWRSLDRVRALHGSGERSAAVLLSEARKVLASAPSAIPEYVELRDAETLAPVDSVEHPAVIALAARVGKTRLIDNVLLPG
ncbi:MAG: pantoate--beta-alanine ligase [Pseudomonadota bacterium]